MRESTQNRVEAILVADLHLCSRPPLCRSIEKDWLTTQRGYLGQLEHLSKSKNAPILCAGDIFDRWNPPVEFVNWVVEYLPLMYAIPGNHDLPNHNYELVKKSAYWSLVLAGKVIDVQPGKPVSVNHLQLHGFPWGTKLKEMHEPTNALVHDIALYHAYVWTKNTGYQGAPEEKRAKHLKSIFSTYDAVVIGDNHNPWQMIMENTSVVNCGGFMRRTIKEFDYQPQIWLLHADRSLSSVDVETEGDQFIDMEEIKKLKIGKESIEQFVSNLKSAKNHTLDFEMTVRETLRENRVDKKTEQAVFAILEDSRSK